MPEYFEDSDRVRMFDFEGVGFAVWFDAPTVDDMKRLWAFAEKLHADHPAGYSYVNLIVSGTPSFSNEVRSEASRIVRETSHWGFGTAHIVLLDGFKGTAVRSFLATAVLLGRPKTPTKVSSDLEEGVSFVVDCMRGEAPAVAEVVAVAREAMERSQAPESVS